MIVFGPVPSRRLGQSLGINNIPPKVCSYCCVYCQVGKAGKMGTERRAFYGVEEIAGRVREKLHLLQGKGERIDYITFVADGEPTLDADLGEEIRALKDTGIPVAVISNASLAWREDVRKELEEADWVSLKVDAAREETWKRINRPCRELAFPEILEGIRTFAAEYEGVFVTETMLIRGVNDSKEEVTGIAEFLRDVKPRTVFLGIPTRPPAEKWAGVPDERSIASAYAILSRRSLAVELLTGYGGTTFGFSGDVEEDVLATASVHPMRHEQVGDLLKKAGAEWTVIEDLVKREKLKKVEYDGRTYYIRNLHAQR